MNHAILFLTISCSFLSLFLGSFSFSCPISLIPSCQPQLYPTPVISALFWKMMFQSSYWYNEGVWTLAGSDILCLSPGTVGRSQRPRSKHPAWLCDPG